MLVVETLVLSLFFFILCFLGTGTDEKNLRSYSSYPDEVQKRIREIADYRGKYKVTGKLATLAGNFLLFMTLFFLLGIPIRQKCFIHNFLCLLIMGQSLNIFDLVVIDLLWWRNTERIRLSKIPQADLYRDPKKHIDAFLRALVLFLCVALVDAYFLTLF